MPLLKPKIPREIQKINLKIDSELLDEAKAYSEFSGFVEIDEMMGEALRFTLNKCKDWKQFKRRKKAALPPQG